MVYNEEKFEQNLRGNQEQSDVASLYLDNGYLKFNLDPEVKRRCELAAEEVVIAYEKVRGWETERVGHLKIGFDIRSLGPVHPETGFRDPVEGVRRIEVKGRSKGKHIRLTTNEWYKAVQLGDTYWLYVIWNPLDNPDPTPACPKRSYRLRFSLSARMA